MKKIDVRDLPHPGDMLGDSVDDFPPGFKYPPEVIIRHCYVNYRPEFLKGAEFVIDGYGALFTKGRDIRFEMEDSYWREKGYPSNCFEGKW